MKKFIIAIIPMFLVGCNGDDKPQPQQPPSSSGWTAYYSKGISACDDFNFGELHYCVKAQPAKLGQTIRFTFTISGTGSLYTVGQGDTNPAAVRLFIWRKGDDISCSGQMQQYRWWNGRTDLIPGTQATMTAVLTPDQWTDCYGQSGTANPGLFQAAIDNAQGIGFTMGGQSFAGHGVAANVQVHFHLDSFTITD